MNEQEMIDLIRKGLDSIKRVEELKKGIKIKDELIDIMRKELVDSADMIMELVHALEAKPYPDCLESYDDGDDYPPNYKCTKWDLWLDYAPKICDKCRGRMWKEDIEKMEDEECKRDV